MASVERLTAAEQLVVTGVALIARQRAMVRSLREFGCDTGDAERTLQRFLAAQEVWEADVSRLRDAEPQPFHA